MTFLGGILGLLAAATFAFNNATARRGVLTGSVAQALAISVPIGIPIFFGVALVAGYLPVVAQFSTRSLVFLSAAGIVHFVWGRYCNFRATKAMGANLVGPVQQLSLLLTLALAIGVLGETLTPLRIIGIVLVVLGPLLTLPRSGPRKQVALAPRPAATGSQPKRFEANYAEGFLWSFLSIFGYGASPILIKLGLESRGLGASLAGGLVAYSAATVVLFLVFLWPGQWRHIFTMRAEPAKWFTISGVLICLSQMMLYMAYAIAPISVVSPIQRLSIVFRVHAGWLINREHEVFGGPVILGTIVSLTGAVALSVSTEMVLAYVLLPGVVVDLARWHWP